MLLVELENRKGRFEEKNSNWRRAVVFTTNYWSVVTHTWNIRVTQEGFKHILPLKIMKKHTFSSNAHAYSWQISCSHASFDNLLTQTHPGRHTTCCCWIRIVAGEEVRRFSHWLSWGGEGGGASIKERFSWLMLAWCFRTSSWVLSWSWWEEGGRRGEGGGIKCSK